MSSGDEDSKDQQVCQTSTWLHFSLQTGGTTTHYSHDKEDTKRRHLSTHGNAVQQGASMRTNVFVVFVPASTLTAGTVAAQPAPLD